LDIFIKCRNLQEEDLNIACVTYTDHSPNKKEVTKIYPFNCSYYAEYYIDSIKYEGGDDDHEAVIDGLYDAVTKLDWATHSEKFVIHFIDSPPHGSRYSYSGYIDNHKNGCPCGRKEEDILIKMNNMKINYIIIKLSNSLDNMIEYFKKYIKLDVIKPNIDLSTYKRINQEIN